MKHQMREQSKTLLARTEKKKKNRIEGISFPSGTLKECRDGAWVRGRGIHEK